MSTAPSHEEWLTIEKTLQTWKDHFLSSQLGHFECANFYRRCSLLLGLSLVICTALVGNSALSEAWKAPKAHIAFVALTVLSTILAAAQTFLRLDETSEKYRAAGSGFIGLRIQIETYRALPRDKRDAPEHFLDGIGKKRETLVSHSPALPQRIYKKYFDSKQYKQGEASFPNDGPPKARGTSA